MIWNIVIILFVPIIFTFITYKVIVKIFSQLKFSAVTKHKLKSQLKLPLILTLYLAALLLLRPFLTLRPEVLDFLKKLMSLSFIFTLMWVSIQLIKVIKFSILRNNRNETHDPIKQRQVQTQLDVFEKIIIFSIIIVGFSISLMLFDRIKEIGTGLLASAGFAGIIIGFAAQKTIGNLFAGIQLAFAQPIRVGDVVVVESEWGIIEEIHLSFVVVKIWDHRSLVLPITYFLENAFQNWTRKTTDILTHFSFHVDFLFPIEVIREELNRILKETPLWDGKVNTLQVIGHHNHSIELRVLMSAKDSPEAWDLKCFVREKIIFFIQQKYPHYFPTLRFKKDISSSS